jgi:GT2 family glycosyltransferase
VGIVAYKGRDYLPKTLEALLAQDYPQKEIIVLDNASPTADQELVKSNFPEVKTVKVTKNLGFSAAHNQIIRQMKGQYYFCLNQDVLLEPNYLTELVSELEAHKTAAAVTGKIKRWDFSTGYKTNFIDSVAIKATRSQRFSNEGQGEIDQGQYEESREIFACPSMAVLLRKTALEDIAYRRSDGVKEYFDELFFMYKEDIDLGYRLRWAGWANLYLPQAVAYHDRKAKDEHSGLWGVLRERKSRPKRLRQWAWINQQILLKKNFSPQFSFATRVKLKWFELTSSFWIRLLEKELSSSFKTIKELDKEIKSRQRQMKKTVKPEELEQFFA